MGRGIARKIIRIAICLIGIVAGGLVCLAVGWSAGERLHGKLSHPEKAAAQALAARFPDGRNQPAASRSTALLAGLMQAKDQQVALLSSGPIVPVKLATAGDAPVEATPGETIQPASEAPAKPVIVASRRTRPNAFLDDDQIANIKKRLNLTAKQERLWPAVETELRKLSFSQPPQPQPKGSKAKPKPPATIELSSAELERLKTAATPLIMSFSDDQKDELRTMARLTGLEKFAP
jgi:hypothetical protein